MSYRTFIFIHTIIPGLDTINTELNDLGIIMICLKNSEVTVEKISVRNVTEKFMERGIQCLSYSYTNNVIDMLS